MIRVLLVDDHDIMRDGLKAILNENSNIEIIGECVDGEEVQPFLDKVLPDVILMDIRMKYMNGIDATEFVNKNYPAVRVLALSMHNEETYIKKMLKAGAAGYVMKNTGANELCKAIETVHNGGSYFSDDVTAVMMSQYLKNKVQPKNKQGIVVEDLTKREKEILGLITEEMTNGEIAEKLFISARTVDTHRRNLLNKLGVRNTAGLVRFAMENNLLEE